MQQTDGAAEALGLMAQKRFGLSKVKLGTKAEQRGDRSIWRGSGEISSGHEVSLAVAYWECDTPARAYLGAYVGSVDSIASGIAILTSARCQ
jgi:hypothetical protein